MDQIAPPPSTGWQAELDELAERKRIARQHAGGRLTVRDRIDGCLDAGSCQEIGSIAGEVTCDFWSAEAFVEIIGPRDTRPLLYRFANMAAARRTPGQSMFTMRP